MGTRNLTCVYLDGEYRVAQYCQWDGYPDGQGKDVLNFLRGELEEPTDYKTQESRYGLGDINYDAEKFKGILRECFWHTDDEIETKWKEHGADGSGMVGMDISDSFSKQYPHLDRSMGAIVLPYILNNGPTGLCDQIGFVGDSLFCEWAYVIDYDRNAFEIYQGFNEVPLGSSERFSKVPPVVKEDGSIKYYPIKFLDSWPLDDLPTFDEMMKAVSKHEGEDD